MKIFKKILSLCISTLLLAAFSLPICAFSAESTNIAKDVDYVITTEANIDNAFPKKKIDDKKKILTDGVKGDISDLFGGKWLVLYRGLSHTITLDFGKEMLVNGYSIGFAQAKNVGIHCTRSISFSVSADGENFYTVNLDEDNSVPSSTAKQRIEKKFAGEKNYKARYVNISFTTDVFNYVDELEIFGSNVGDAAETKYTADPQKTYKNAFASNKNPKMNNISDLVLMYNGEYYNKIISDVGKNTSEELLPYAAYLDKSGKILDTMFDSFLFLPLNPGEDFSHSLKNQAGWESYLNNTIGKSESINLTALNNTVGDLKGSLKLDKSYKVNVFLTVPFLQYSSDVFGNLDGENAIAPNSLENRKSIIKWYIDLFISQYKAQDFQNLNLVGFYWYSEGLSYADDPNEDMFVKAFNEYVHSKNLASIWIPYYCSPGFDKWQELGFDCATLQSGYAFPKDSKHETGNPLKGTCNDSMSIAKKYGLGVEIELSLVNDAPARYDDYLQNSCILGCMKDGVTMYYQAGGPGDFFKASKSNSADVRNIYDLTYKYIKKTYTVSAPYCDFSGTILAKNDGTKTMGTLPIKDDDTAKPKLKAVITKNAEHGEFLLEGDGFFIYTAKKDFAGKDAVSFKISDGINESKIYTINILVVKDLLYINGIDMELKENKAIIYSTLQTTGTSDKIDKVFEVLIDNNNIVTSASYSYNSAIPKNGKIVAAHGEKAEWLKNNAAVGTEFLYDELTKTAIFTKKAIDDASNVISSEASESEKTTPISKITLIVIILIVLAAVAAVITIVIIKNKKRQEKIS